MVVVSSAAGFEPREKAQYQVRSIFEGLELVIVDYRELLIIINLFYYGIIFNKIIIYLLNWPTRYEGSTTLSHNLRINEIILYFSK